MFEHERSVSTEPLRRTGIRPIGDKPWGTHMCLFYDTAQDLLDVHASYLGAGLADGEYCIWALSGPVNPAIAIESLRGSIPDFDDHLREGRIELVPGYDWYLDGDEFDHRRIITKWHNNLDQALARGFPGIRVSGNAFWCETGTWNAFRDYEAELGRTLVGRRMLVLCTYPLSTSRAVDVLDVTRMHHFSVSIRNGRWEVLQAPEVAEAWREIVRFNNPVDIAANSVAGRLTHREQVVLAQLFTGASSKETARLLNISPRTVEFHRGNIMRKLGARNMVDLVATVLGTR